MYGCGKGAVANLPHLLNEGYDNYVQAHVWDGVKNSGNQWAAGDWSWQATLHTTSRPAKGDNRDQKNLPALQPQEKNLPFPKSKADNPVPRQTIRYQGSYR